MCRRKSGSRAPASAAAMRRADRFESEALEFHEKLRDGLSQLAAERAGPLRADRRRPRPRETSPNADLEHRRDAPEPGRCGATDGRGRLVSADERRGASDGRIRAKPDSCSAMRRPSGILLEAYRSGRIPHAWLIGGPRGIGKATLAYRMARFVLAHPDPGSTRRADARSLAVDPEHPVARRIAAQAHRRSAGAGADRQRTRQAAHGHRGRRRAPHGVVFRFDRRGGGLARLPSSTRSTS